MPKSDLEIIIRVIISTSVISILFYIFFPIGELQTELWSLFLITFVLDIFITVSLARFELAENKHTLTRDLCGEYPSPKCMVIRGGATLSVIGLSYSVILISEIRLGDVYIAYLLPMVFAIGGIIVTFENIVGMTSNYLSINIIQ